MLSKGLKKRGSIAVASGGLSDIWGVEYDGGEVAVKAFRINSPQNLKEAKEVRTQSTWKVHPRTKFTDSLETGAQVEKAFP